LILQEQGSRVSFICGTMPSIMPRKTTAMSNQLSQTTLETLAFIRYMYGAALEQSEKPEPFSSSAILTLHDSVELFLQLASVQPNVSFNHSNPSFLDYWQMTTTGGKGLTQKTAMATLNKVRVNLKHTGVFMPKREIKKLEASVLAFFEENAPIIFDIAFEAISMALLVHHDKARENLENAESLVGQGKLVEAMNEIALAFKRIILSYEWDRNTFLRHDPHTWSADDELARNYRLHLQGSRDHSPDIEAIIRGIGDYFDKVQERINDMEPVLLMLSIGLDYRRYYKFMAKTPIVKTYIQRNSDEGVGYQIFPRQNYAPTLNDYYFCMRFVVEAAIAVQTLLED
jgi:hypothetical protein